MVSQELRQRLEDVFTLPQVEVFVDWAEEYRKDQVKVSDFLELKEIVRDLAEGQRKLAEAQQRTEVKVEQLVEAQQRTEVKVERLVEAQQRTEVKVERLTEAQQRTEVKVEQLAEAMRGMAETQAEMLQTQSEMLQTQARMLHTQAEMQQSIAQLARGLDEVRSLTGSNSQTLGYMLENEAYRNVPVWLREQRRIEVLGRMIRQQVGDEEINLLVDARQGNEEVLIVGEAKSRLHLSDLGLLAVKVEAVKEHYVGLRGRRIVPLLIAHFAPENVKARAEREGVIIVQSFEW